jgi:thymidylate synthase (FAD)
MSQIDLECGGFVRLDAYMADDLSVVNSARVSFGKRTETMSVADKGLIRFLMRERHGTPFEHNAFRFHASVPIFVAREWFRHRIGWSYNEYSARYSEMPKNWYVPETEVVRSQVGKPGSYTFEPLDTKRGREVAETINEANSHSYRTYQYLIEIGVAKELARTVLPVGMFTEFYATCNARSLMNFCSLRSAETAQYEIRVASLAVEKLFAEIMPVTYEAFLDNGKVAP